uniref:Uncharacterized protein n=1 Tax=uncultured marine virus TaxID=186617 RepID=A0A0F7L1Y6_9VIRU|nr:hypothetical protein [uncultured marine virus]
MATSGPCWLKRAHGAACCRASSRTRSRLLWVRCSGRTTSTVSTWTPTASRRSSTS